MVTIVEASRQVATPASRLAMALVAALLAAAVPGQGHAEQVSGEIAASQSLLGSYLAGRVARDEREPALAAQFFREALDRDPASDVLLREAFESAAEAGEWRTAEPLADRLVAVEPTNRLARAFLGVKAFKAGDFTVADGHFKEAGAGPIGELTSTLARAWIKAGEGDFAAGVGLLQSLGTSDWARYYRLIHTGLLADLAGDTVTADQSFGELFKAEPKTLTVTLAYVRHALAAGNRKLALATLQAHLEGGTPVHPMVQQLIVELRSGQKVGLYVDTPRRGLAESLFGLGEALNGEGGVGIGTIYLQLALYLEPDLDLALAGLANVQEGNRQYARAIETYDRIGKGSPIAFQAIVRKALNLNALERSAEAKAALVALFKEPAVGALEDISASDVVDLQRGAALPRLQVGAKGADVEDLQRLLGFVGFDSGPVDGLYGRSTVDAVKALQTAEKVAVTGSFDASTKTALVGRIERETARRAAEPGRARGVQLNATLGNILRGNKEFGEAKKYYSDAIALIEKPDRRNWNEFYSRAVCSERLGQWDEAEADFLKAMELDGDQAVVLNYLGYSWVDRGLNLDRAMGLIRKAVQLKPDDGYYVDSLGWAHYKLGQFDEAVQQLERAVELRPDDSVINDHLGDAYWRVGRRLEAKFQWAQALTLKPEPEEVPKIEAKIKDGLDGSGTGTSGDAQSTDAGKRAESAAPVAPVQ